MKLLFLLLITSVTYGQKSDTIKVNLIIGHKIKTMKPSETIGGYAIRTGRKTRYVDCEYKPLPMYVVVNKVKYVQ